MMRWYIAAVCILLTACVGNTPVQAQCSGSQMDADPVAVLFQHSPWTGGTETPLFVLYEDGTAIYPAETRDGEPVAYRVACVEGSAEQLRERFGVGRALRDLEPRYDYRPGWSDQESVLLFSWSGDSLTRVTVRAGRVSAKSFSPAVPRGGLELGECLG